MKSLSKFLLSSLVAGVLVAAPIYLSILLLLKAMKSLTGLLKPFTKLLPASWPAVDALSLLLVLVFCFFVGVVVRTQLGRIVWERAEGSLFQRIPGYSILQGLTRQLAGKNESDALKPALIEMNDGLVPGFIIEEVGDGRFTVFLPSSPTPVAGEIYILPANRIHPLDIPFTQAIGVISKWGSGSKNLVAAMERAKTRGLLSPEV